ncbi:hypothetical protein MPTK1_8g18095 [Marchantia polymorpha subsp. ruderalis]
MELAGYFRMSRNRVTSLIVDRYSGEESLPGVDQLFCGGIFCRALPLQRSQKSDGAANCGGTDSRGRGCWCNFDPERVDHNSSTLYEARTSTFGQSSRDTQSD